MFNIESISHIWNVIVRSNTFNFIIFVLILAWIFKKINIGAIISSLQQKIVKLLDEAKKEKEEAKKTLLNAEKDVENLPAVLNEIIQDAKKSAEVITKKILTEAEKQIESIESNAEKVIEAEEKLLISKLTKSTSQASVEMAKTHIQNVLVQTPSLHEKYINNSIDELDRLKW